MTAPRPFCTKSAMTVTAQRMTSGFPPLLSAESFADRPMDVKKIKLFDKIVPIFTTGKLKFVKGDYKAMLKDPRMAGPFVKSFGLMQRIGAA